MTARTLLTAVLLILTTWAATPLPAAFAQKGGVIDVPSSDQEMNAAIAKARSTLDVFWKSLEKPGPGEEEFALKVRIAVGGTGSDSGEHIWMNGIERLADGRIAGRLANQPQRFKGRIGERRVFSADDISDWMFIRNGKFVGMETMRPMLKRMPKEQADGFRARMENP